MGCHSSLRWEVSGLGSAVAFRIHGLVLRLWAGGCFEHELEA